MKVATRGQQKRPKVEVLSPKGRRDMKLVAGARLAAAAFIIVALASTADLIGGRIGQVGLPAVTLRDVALPVGAALVAGLFAFSEILYGGMAARAEEKRVRARLLEEIFTAPSLPDHTDPDSDASQLITLMTDNSERLTEYRQVYFGATLAAISVPFMTLAYVAIAYNALIGLSLMGLFVLIPILIGAFMAMFRKTSANSRKERAELSGKYLDAIRNLVLIRLMGAGPRVEQQLREQGERNRGAIMKLLAGNQIVIIVMDGLFSLLLILAAAALSIGQVHAGNLTVTHAIAVMLLTTLLVEPLVQVAGFFYIGMGGMASERRIRKYLTDQGAAKEAAYRSVSDSPTQVDLTSGIELRGVHHDYGRGVVLDDLNLQVPHGTKSAIIGRSGAGKSTLLSLLRGTLPLQTGGMVIEGQDCSTLTPGELRSLSATVSQRTWLFTGTIADNLRLAAPQATDEELWAALETAEVADEVRRMPQQLETPVGEGGGLISGGQAQRLSLARALLSGRKVLLLDEATSQIDAASEERLIKALDGLDEEWTVLLVTHRHSLLSIADRVCTLHAGQLSPEPVLAPTPNLSSDHQAHPREFAPVPSGV